MNRRRYGAGGRQGRITNRLGLELALLVVVVLLGSLGAYHSLGVARDGPASAADPSRATPREWYAPRPEAGRRWGS